MPRQLGIYSLHSKALILLHNVGKIRAKNHEKKCREALSGNYEWRVDGKLLYILETRE